eukprot:scaffold2016_cov63-Phaeocystis_antarctica.AAC.8
MVMVVVLLLVVPPLAAAPLGGRAHLRDLQRRVLLAHRADPLHLRPPLAARLQTARGGALEEEIRIGRQQRPAPLRAEQFLPPARPRVGSMDLEQTRVTHEAHEVRRQPVVLA